MDEPKVFKPTRSKYLVLTTDYLLPIFICLSIISLICFVLYSPFFKITKINCSLDFKDCTDPALIAELDKLKGQNIFTISPGYITSRLTSGDFTIRESVMTRELPGTVGLELQSVYPVVALQIIGDPTWVIMDSKFRVIGTRTTDPNVPTVIVAGPINLTVGKPPTTDLILKALGIAKRLSDVLFSIKTISLIDDDTIELALADKRIAIFTPKKDELDQLRILQTILGDDTIIKGVKTIDVRFSQPVLR